MRMFSGDLDKKVYRQVIRAAADQQLTPEAFQAMLQSAELKKSMARALREVVGAEAKALLAALDERAPTMLRERRAEFKGFERRLHRSWRKPLDRLEQLLVIAAETGELFSAQWPWAESQDADLVFDVVRRLQARACQVAGEVLTLLKAGYPSGAHARWRAMHETAVTAAFIAKHGRATAERYLLHEHVEAHDAIQLYQEHAKALKLRPYRESELNARAEVRETLGKQFKHTFVGP